MERKDLGHTTSRPRWRLRPTPASVWSLARSDRVRVCTHLLDQDVRTRSVAVGGTMSRVGEVLAQLVGVRGHPVSNAHTSALNDRRKPLPS